MQAEIKVDGISFRVEGWSGRTQKQIKEKAERQGLRLNSKQIRELYQKLKDAGDGP